MGLGRSANRKHRELTGPLGAWLEIVRGATWRSLADVRRTLRDTDAVRGKGNKYRLIAIVNYESETVIVKHLLTHAEYARGSWNK